MHARHVLCFVLLTSGFAAAQVAPPARPAQNAGTAGAPPAATQGARTGQPAPAGAQQSGEPQITPEQALRMAQQYIDANRKNEAAQLLSQIIKAAPEMLEAHLLLGELSVEGNYYDAARDSFKTVLAKEPSNFRANLGMGKIYYANSLWPQATVFLENAEKVAPEQGRSEVKRLLAMVYDKMSKVQGAIDKALEAVQANPDDLDALATLVEVRKNAATRNPQFMIGAVADGERLVQKCMERVVRAPWKESSLTRLDAAYKQLHDPPDKGILQTYYHWLCLRNPRGEVVDQLQDGKGPEAAGVLLRMTEVVRQKALLDLIVAEQQALAITERAVSPTHDPRNVKGLQAFVASCDQIQELTARLAGNSVLADTMLRDKAILACRHIMQLDPKDEFARGYLERVGAPLTAPVEPGAPAATGTGPGAGQPTTAPAPGGPVLGGAEPKPREEMPAPAQPKPGAAPSTQPASEENQFAPGSPAPAMPK